MALQKQLVHLNMTGGMQRKDDQFIVIPSKLTEALDVEFDDASTVVRRGGQASLGVNFGTGPGYRVFRHKGRALLETENYNYRLFSTGSGAALNLPNLVDGFAPPRAFRRAGMTTERVAGINQKASATGAGIPLYSDNHDCVSVGNVTCFAMETKDPTTLRQSVRVIVRNDSTGSVLYDTIQRDGTNLLVKPRVVTDGVKFFVFFGSFTSGASAYDLKSIVVTTAGTATGINTVIACTTTAPTESAAGSFVLFDVAVPADNSVIGVSILKDPGVLRSAAVVTADGFTVAVSNDLVPAVDPLSLTALFTKDATNYRLHSFYSINTNACRASYFDFTAVAASAEITVGTGDVGSVVGRIAAYENSATQIYVAFDTMRATGTALTSVLRVSRVNHTLGALIESACAKPYVIAGRIASIQNRLYLPLAFLSSNAQSVILVADFTSALANLGTAGALGSPLEYLARIDYGEVALNYSNWFQSHRVPAMVTRGTTLLLPYLKFEMDLRKVGTGDDTQRVVSLATIDMSSQLADVEVNGVTFLAGACPHIYDGVYYVEEGFHHGPEVFGNPTAGAAGTYQLCTNPAPANATYTLCFTLAWMDSQGNWHESAPSNEVSVSVTAGSANVFVTPALVVPDSLKPGTRVLMYRTKGSSTDTSLYAAVNAAGVSVTSDTDLDDGEQLYTAGNVLPNTPAPACRHVSLFQKRLVLSGCGDGSKVHWSKTSTPGYGVEFSSGDPTHQTVVPSDKGRVVATEEMDDRLVVLCENGVGIISGTGPAPTGTQGQYSDYSSIITEVGCSWDSPKSVIRGPEGVWFRSPFGIRLVSRSGSLARTQDGKQVGSEVDPLVSGNVVSIAGDAKQQVRFFAGSGRCFVWDYQWLQWTRFSGMSSVDAVYADDRYYCLSNYSTTTPLLRYTSDSVYTDVTDAGVADQIFNGYIETPWLAMGGIQGFQRVYRLMILGKNKDSSVQPQTIGLSLNYDYQAAFSSDAPAVSVTPTAGGVIQYQHHFVQQKCEAIKIAVYFFPTTAGNTGKFRLTDLTLQVGVKAGLFKVPSSQRF